MLGGVALALFLLLYLACQPPSSCLPTTRFLPVTAAILAAVILLGFLVTTLPFLAKAWRKDPAVALVTPFLLASRAMALGLGYGWGIIQPARAIRAPEDTIGGLSYLAKRLLDVTGAFTGLIFTLIVWCFVAPAIKLDSQGPVIFRQERVGQGGRPFTLYKFRTMNANATEELALLIESPGLIEPVLKVPDDPRLTRVGRFLRRWSLDELPQFWNVLKGDMSLVGPRPEEERVVEHYNDWHRRRLAVKPGMTGPMQINGRADLSLDERVALELDYIEHFSLRRDLHIMARTLPAILKGKGAF
jgi:lipopolysaccharide/colanic/teichoic acid biosynthesis glycosyltransferase